MPQWREGGSHEGGKVSMHWETPSQVGPRGSCGTSESHAKMGAQKAKYRESCTSWPISSSQVLALLRGLEQGAERYTHKSLLSRRRTLYQEKHTGASTKQGGLGEPRDPHRSLQLASYGLQHRVRPWGGGSGKDPREM